MSLGGLAVAIGLIIDDTVVVVENISRHLAAGETGDVAIDSGQPRDQRGGHRIDVHHDPCFRAVGLRRRRDRAILPVAESGTGGIAVGVDGGQPDDHSRAGRAVPGPAADARDRPDLRRLAAGYEGMLQFGLRFPRLGVLAAMLMIFRPGGSSTWKPVSCPTWTRGPSWWITSCPWERPWAKRTRSSAGWRRFCKTRPTWRATSAARGRKWVSMQPSIISRRHSRRPQAPGHDGGRCRKLSIGPGKTNQNRGPGNRSPRIGPP